ncbi:ABC transporter substrate-binding protein [Verticiella sediminum]|uniref:ABC transporter substrate-binding protein n=1 Tax=Verticiella sediminum TaxID=1247510 RepID=A0A556AJ97_9BURK|nr:TRAP transporter substrate-binding protein DctP [Verticiella sediminum]TSH92972.1 ABC transporter substrate-binding protein [Verticiella sediminum]
MKRAALSLLLAASSLALGAGTAAAAEVTLKAINSFQEGTYFAQNFEAFVKKVNEEGKGLVQIQYVGGPKAVPTMEQGAALRAGVVDMANTTAAYTAGIVPEVLSLNYATVPFQDLRTNGGLDYLNGIMAEKNLMYFARTGDRVQYHIYLTKPIDKPDLKGLKIRIAPIFRDFFQALGATVVQTAPGEVYTALERGVVDGYGWPLLGIFDMGWQEITKYRVDPGFYMLELGVQFNKKSWDRLSPEQQAFLEKQRDWLEQISLQRSLDDVDGDLKRQAEAGIEPITFSAGDTQQYLNQSLDAAWAAIVKNSPKHGEKLRELMIAR